MINTFLFIQAVVCLVVSGRCVAGFFRLWCGWFLQAVVFLQVVVWLVSLSGKSSMLLVSIKLLVSTRRVLLFI